MDETVTIIIYNSMGQIVKQLQNLHSNSAIEVTNLLPGLYSIQLNSVDKKYSRKRFIIE
jgi:hypothetical protein